MDNPAFEAELDPNQGDEAQRAGTPKKIKNIELQVDWTAAMPDDLNVPKVDIHSFVMDFTAVSFIDVMSAKSLKLVGFFNTENYFFTTLYNNFQLLRYI